MSTDQLFANRYQLDRRLGVGGMATVQLAFDTRLERYVAVKLLAEHLAEDASFISRFRREALAAARLVHPNVVQVFDFGLDDASSRQFIVMEYVDGQSCAEILRERGALPPGEAIEILTQACRGLDYAHRNGVVHRDVKPGNLMVSRDGLVKLADFGIAKAAEQSDITKVGSVLGTAAYLAPEQARGEPAGPASDLYALGVVSYQLMAGRLPYEAASLTDLARLQESGPPPRLDDVSPEVPPSLAAAVAQALARDPADRYADAPDMEQALRDGLRGVGPTSAAWPDEDTAATRAMSRTQATTALPPQRRRQLEPLEEEPYTPAPAPQPRRGRAAPPAAPPRRRRRRPFRLFVALIVLLALVAGGLAGYQALETGNRKAIELRENVEGTVDQAVDELRGLIEDNTK